MPTRVAIVEDNSGICRELQHLLATTGDLTCVAACRNVQTALETLPSCAPDVIVMDIQLPGRTGIECTAALKPLLPDAQILMFTIYDDREKIVRALSAGAIGYILKSSTPDEILDAIREAHARGAPMSNEVSRKVIETFHHQPAVHDEIQQLTPREIEVVGLLAKGFVDKQIAEQLAMSVMTVNSHLKHIYAKLNAHSRTEVVVKFISRGNR